MSYAGLTFLTADTIGDALVDLAAVLPKAEAVEIPIVDDAGKVQRARLVIGPTSQLIAVPEDSRLREPEDNGTSEQLRTRALAARSSRTTIATTTEPLSTGFEELEFP